jgi:flavin-dependent dehydrogenase
MMTENGELGDGARIAVIGGGPSGAFFSIFAMKMARMVDKKISVTIFEPKEFNKFGPAGCNRCGGVISELLVQMLAVEGINLPDSVVQRGINSYELHTERGSVTIAAPSMESSIATVYRGGGPLGLVAKDKESFDHFLLQTAMHEGAERRHEMVDRVEYRRGRPVLFSRGKELMEADLVVGAYGVNSPPAEILGQDQFEYRRPKTVTTGIGEIILDAETMDQRFRHAIQLFLLPVKNLKFAAMIPKGTHLTVCLLGKDLDAQSVSRFLEHPVVRDVIPASATPQVCCRCLPKMNVQAPRVGYADRFVMCGDAGSTRLFKDGLGAAYIMGKAAAITAVFHGVSRRHFEQFYQPVYRGTVIDNWFGQYLFAVTDIYKRYGVLTRAMLEVVRQEQRSSSRTKAFSNILWNMFTGNERYKNIFLSALSVPMHLDIWAAMARMPFQNGGKT